MSNTELGRAIELVQEESYARACAEHGLENGVAFVDIPNDPLERYVRVTPEGVSDPITPPPERLDVNAMSLGQFADVAKTWGVRTVLVGPNTVVGLVDPGDRRDRVRLLMPFTSVFVTVSKWQQRTQLSQTDLVRLLRLDLSSCVVSDSAKQLLRFAESYTVTSAGSQGATIRKDRESLGRSIEDSVRAEAGDCPDSVTLDVIAHSDSALQSPHRVRIAVDFSPSASTFFVQASEVDLQAAVERQIAAAIGALTLAFGNAGPAIVAATI